ncbi:MAG: DNA-directed RNA polymerase subunit L [Candidatus Bathyarchaeia archaeon]
MKINVISRGSNELKIEIEGEDHTFCNVLQNVLLEDESVDLAGYRIDHPLTSNPVFYVRTRGDRKPIDALKDAAKKILRTNEELRQAFIKAIEEFSSRHQGRVLNKGT